jgi:ABC-type antimicrobial peptide transport system permease subunit
VGRIESFQGRVGEQQRDIRGIVALGLVFGALALALAALGLYALQGYTVRRRTREIGIRIAIGAGRRDILWLVVRQAVALVSIGSTCGLAVAIPMSAIMRSVLAGTGAFEPWALLPTIGALFVVSILASAGPAWRAASIDPVRALRQD